MLILKDTFKGPTSPYNDSGRSTSPTAMTQPSIDEVDELIKYGLGPLAEDKYPRVFQDRKPTKGYYVALALVLSVWMITPLSWFASRSLRCEKRADDACSAYLIWFVLLARGMTGAAGLTGTMFAAYALTEVSYDVIRQAIDQLAETRSRSYSRYIPTT